MRIYPIPAGSLFCFISVTPPAIPRRLDFIQLSLLSSHLPIPIFSTLRKIGTTLSCFKWY